LSGHNRGGRAHNWHTRPKPEKVPTLERLSPQAWVEMNPRDARTLRLSPQIAVNAVPRAGAVAGSPRPAPHARGRGLELRVTETVARGQIFVPFHYAEANANEVTQSAFDPHSREPNYKQSAARVEPAGDPRGGAGRAR